MELLTVSKENLDRIEQAILNTSEEEFDNIYSNDNYLFQIMELTKNRQVFLKCMNFISIPFLLEKLKSKEISKEMVFKLSLHPYPIVQLAILKRDDVTPELLKQMIENFKDEEILSTRYSIINHKSMNEDTLYELCDYDNNQILSQVLLTDKVSNRILKKLQKSTDDEIRTMAKVRDPETDPEYIGKVLRREFRKAIKNKGEYINTHNINSVSIVLNDILEASIRNPSLPTDLVELYKKSNRSAIISFVIPHTNISKNLLNYYSKKGDKGINEAISKRSENQQTL